MASKYIDGSVWESVNCGKFIILSESQTEKNVFSIQFLDDGTIIERAKSSNFKRGTVDNPNKRTIFGKGYRGQGKWKAGDGRGGHSKEYNLWHGMLKRCYDVEYLKRFPTYKSCTVCDEWLNFQVFCEDIKTIENYDKWLEFGKEYQLDKDIKLKGNKIYSKETCKFVYYIDNIRDGVSRRKLKEKTYTVYCAKKNGATFIGTVEEISKKTNLPKGTIYSGASNCKRYYDWEITRVGKIKKEI